MAEERRSPAGGTEGHLQDGGGTEVAVVSGWFGEQDATSTVNRTSSGSQ